MSILFHTSTILKEVQITEMLVNVESIGLHISVTLD